MQPAETAHAGWANLQCRCNSLTVRKQTMLEGKGTLLPPAAVSMPQVLWTGKESWDKDASTGSFHIQHDGPPRSLPFCAITAAWSTDDTLQLWISGMPRYTGNQEEELSGFPWQGSTPLSPYGNPSPEKAIMCQLQDGITEVLVGVVSHTPCPQASMTQKKKKTQKRYFCIEDATTDLTFTNLPNPLLKVSNA